MMFSDIEMNFFFVLRFDECLNEMDGNGWKCTEIVKNP
jgi:hypothetical protein